MERLESNTNHYRLNSLKPHFLKPLATLGLLSLSYAFTPTIKVDPQYFSLPNESVLSPDLVDKINESVVVVEGEFESQKRRCTGVSVGDHRIETAKHCIFGDEEYKKPVSNLEVLYNRKGIWAIYSSNYISRIYSDSLDLAILKIDSLLPSIPKLEVASKEEIKPLRLLEVFSYQLETDKPTVIPIVILKPDYWKNQFIYADGLESNPGDGIILPGASGSPAVNLEGDVAGIITRHQDPLTPTKQVWLFADTFLGFNQGSVSYYGVGVPAAYLR